MERNKLFPDIENANEIMRKTADELLPKMIRSFGSGPHLVLFDRSIPEVFKDLNVNNNDEAFATIMTAYRIFMLWMEGEFHWKSYSETLYENLDKLLKDDITKWEHEHGCTVKDVYLYFMGVNRTTHSDVIERVRNMYAFGTVCGRQDFSSYGKYFKILLTLEE